MQRALVRHGHKVYVEFYDEDGVHVAYVIDRFDHAADARWWLSKQFPDVKVGGGC